MPSRVPTYQPRVPEAPRHRDYDRFARDPESRAFYHSAAWKKLRAMKRRATPLCETCAAEGRLTPAAIVHHKVEVKADPGRRLEWGNLQSLCLSCHSRLHGIARANPATGGMRPT